MECLGKNPGLEFLRFLVLWIVTMSLFTEVVRAMTYLINNGMIMYWGTARWGPVEIYECFTKGRELGQIGPVCELGEYHWFHREKVEVYMAELYNKVGEPVSLSRAPRKKGLL